jgi:hypothetical protein
LFRLVSLRSCCIAPKFSSRFFTKGSVACGLRPAAYGKPRACIFADIYKRIVLRSICWSLHAKNPRAFRPPQAPRAEGSLTIRPRERAMRRFVWQGCAGRIAEIENNRRIRVNKS